MRLFSILYFLTISFICALNLQGQTMRADSTSKTAQSDTVESVYRKTYTFQEASDFVKKGAYHEAMWFYINLYLSSPDETKDAVMTLKPIIKDIEKVVRASYTMYAPFDPDASEFSNGALILDRDKMRSKGKAADELIKILSEE